LAARGITPEARTSSTETIKKVFLEAYAACGAIGPASRKAGVDRDTILRWRHKDKAFDKAVMNAKEDSVDALRLTAFQRAINGTSKGADTLMIFLLKAGDPEMYRERYDVHSSGSFTLRDFLLFGERQATNGKTNPPENVRKAGVVFNTGAGDQPLGQAAGNHREPEDE